MPRRGSTAHDDEMRTVNTEAKHARAKDERRLNAAQREKMAIELRMQGYDFDTIAQMCGYSNRSGAYHAWKRAIQRIPRAEIDAARENMRQSYDAMRRALWPQVQNGKTWAIEAWLKVDEREARLFGYDTKSEQALAASQVLVRRYDADVEAV